MGHVLGGTEIPGGGAVIDRPNPGLTRDEHIARHVNLHRMFDELAADYLAHDRTRRLSDSLLDLIRS